MFQIEVLTRHLASKGPVQLTGDDLAERKNALQVSEADILACRGDLAANVPAEKVLKRLREFGVQARTDSWLYAQWLVAEGIAINRLGIRGEALGGLNEAADIFERLSDGPRLAEAKRTIALVHAWRGEGRDAGLSLLRAIAESLASNDLAGAALALIEAGRLEMEMGRSRVAAPLFERALSISGADIPQMDRRRAEINQLQAHLAAGRMKDVRRHYLSIRPNLLSAPPRLRFLAAIELVRFAQALGSYDEARRLLESARRLTPGQPGDFEAFELAEAEAELAVAEHDLPLANANLERVIARYAEDDLAGREVKARLMRATALDGLGRFDEAEQTLAAALRRAVARGLIGHADEVRARLAAIGSSEEVGTSSTPPYGQGAQDPSRRFVRRRPLGEGGQGSVYRAYDIELGGEVALKRYSLTSVYDTQRRERLIAAARIEFLAASRIDHPGVARIQGLVVEPGGDAILVEELVEGPSLRVRMSSAIDTPQALDLIARLAFALSAIHSAGIVHCDLKPENIVISSATRPVIVDFGIALLDPKSRTRRGSPAYMAPEQKRGGRSDARTDLFALGLIAHELLGIEPSVARRFWMLRDGAAGTLPEAGVEPRVAKLIRRLVAPVKWLRPRSAAEVGQIIARGP
jgi:tRNA A-37 threonylcarbamoyl transferase component Bud32